MTPERWQQVKQLFDQAAQHPETERQNFLEHACGNDHGLRDEVAHLLRAHGLAGTFLDKPLVHLASEEDQETSEQLAIAPRQIGPWQIEKTLGRGGMGTVFLASRADGEYRHQAAVKLIRRELDNEDLIRRFRSERQILAHLDHPNIARLIEGGSQDGLPYLAMEYVPGEPLDIFCDRHDWSVTQRLELFSKICSAVHFAHQSLIVHRDLKPGNILVNSSGEPKLLDFGIAKLLSTEEFDHTVAATRPGVNPMTLEYASPEQVLGEPMTTASDIYSLGVILYRLLSASSPYEAQNARQLADDICHGNPPRPSARVTEPTFRPWPSPTLGDANKAVGNASVDVSADPQSLQKRRQSLAGDLDNIVLKAMDKNPQRRYSSAEEFAADIHRYLTHRPVAARPDTLVYRTRKFVRRHRWGVAASTFLVLCLIGFISVLTFQKGQILRQKIRAEEVTKVLVDLFEVSDPDRALGAKVTAREVMERGAREIPLRLQGQPDLQADLLETIGHVYRKLGLYEESSPVLQQALDLRLLADDEKYPAIADNLMLQADVFSLKGDLEQAEQLYRQALTRFRKTYPRNEAGIERGLFGLATVLTNQGNYTAAENLHREALAIAGRLFGFISAQTATNLNHLGRLWRQQGDYPAALRNYHEALEIYRQLHGEFHPEVAGVLNNLALAHQQGTGDLEQAETLFRRALKIQQKLYDPTHPSLANTQTNLASLLHDKRQFEEAETLCRTSLETRQEIYGEQHPKVAESLNLLGLIRRDLGDPEEAERRIRLALDTWKQTLGEEHGEAAVGLANLALVLQQQGDLEQAEDLNRQALKVSRAVFGQDHSRVAAILHNLARLLRQRGDLLQAQDLYQQALDMQRRLLGDQHPDIAQTLHNLAAVLRDRQNYDEAALLYAQALNIYRSQFGADHPNVGLSMQSLAAVRGLQGNPQEAAKLAQQAVQNLSNALPADHLWVAAARSVWGKQLTDLGQFEAAEKELLASYRQLHETHGPDSKLTQRTRGHLVSLYEGWDKQDQAALYRAH